MTELPQIDDYKDLFLKEIEMMDVRAPIEFSQGAFPHTLNLPLMSDDEREAVGLCYKKNGQDKAIELGHQLVSGETKEQRVNDWSHFVKTNPHGVLYCFRGGLRSKITQQWIYEKTGKIYPRVKGGYKAMRRFLIDELVNSANTIKPIMLGGRTGIGKTPLLAKLEQKLEHEAIYHHRGSGFGKHATPQPSQIDVENSLSIEFIKLREKGFSHIVLEDEGNNIVPRCIPDALSEKIKSSPLILLEDERELCTANTLQAYIHKDFNSHTDTFG